MQYQLVLPDKRTLTFDPTQVTFHSAEYTDTVYGDGLGMHTFSTQNPDFLDRVRQVMSTGSPLMEFRLGYGSPNNMFWLPWQRHLICSYAANFVGIAPASGHLLVFNTKHQFAKIERSIKVVARQGTISEIVRRIADENQLEAVIESTEGRFLLLQTYMDDITFIMERLLPRALTAKGRGGFFCFIRDNVLHFHTPDYQSSVQQLNYYDTFGTALNLVDVSQTERAWDAGVAGTCVIAHDALTGQSKETKSRPDNALRLADTIYAYESVSNGQLSLPYHHSSNPMAEVTALAQHSYQRARLSALQCTFSVDKLINIRHGNLLNLVLTQQSSKASSHSGFYYVIGACHVIKKQAVNSTYTLYRGELRGTDQSLTVQRAQQQLIPETKAPGQDPCLPSVNSSERTRGAGNRTSATSYLTVADAQTGLPLA